MVGGLHVQFEADRAPEVATHARVTAATSSRDDVP
jgi:hypothetical protein